jgi:hypothetical protein
MSFRTLILKGGSKMASIFQKCNVAVLLVILITGCSGAVNSVVPSTQDSTSSTQSIDTNLNQQTATGSENSSANHFLLSYNLIYLDATDPNNIKAEIIPVREGEIHLNILKFLEDGPCTTCFKIIGFNFPQPGYLDVDIKIDHPFGDLTYSIFDVRGLMMFQGNHEFPIAGKSMSDPALGDGALLNPDGYTALYNGSTATAPVGPLQKYYPGNLATSAIPNSDINGYIFFKTDDPANNRNAFYANSIDVKTFSLKLPSDNFVIGYAVDASWAPPIETPVDDPLTDFDLNANCPEPWRIEVSGDPIEGTNETVLTVNVYDWQGKLTHYAPVVECPELFSGTKTGAWVGDGDGYSQWEVVVSNETDAAEGSYWSLVSVEDMENNPDDAPWLDLKGYQIFEVGVIINSNFGWARTFGGIGDEKGVEVKIDKENNVYIAGWFSDDVDFDPGQVTELHSSNGSTDSYISKFDQVGNQIWTETWGSTGTDAAYGIAFDSENNILVTGYFSGTVDFDPSQGGVNTQTAAGNEDMFVSKFDSNGQFIWVRTGGQAGNDGARGVGTDNNNNVFVVGYTEVSGDTFDSFLAKISSNGSPLWNISWGGTTGELSYGDEMGLCMDLDASMIYVTGEFMGTVDFNPGSEVDNHTSAGDGDAFLSKFDTEGNFQWARTWGGDGFLYECGTDVDLDLSGNVYVTGYFCDWVDFDPGPGGDLLYGNGWDAFVTKFNPDGEYQWAVGWGGDDKFYQGWGYGESGSGITVDESGTIFVTGNFGGTADFDPGSGSFELTASGVQDAYVIALDSSGSLIWVRNFSGLEECCMPNQELYWESGSSVDLDSFGRVYVAGYWSADQGSGDFAPTGSPCNSDPDIHTTNGQFESFILKYLPDGCWQ